MTAAYYRSFKCNIFILTGHAAAGLVVAEKRLIVLADVPTAGLLNLDYGSDQMAERAIDERIDRLGLLIPPTVASSLVTA
jgi:hypothetical protein